MLSTRDPPQNRDTYRLKVKGWKKIFHANRDQKNAGIAILIVDKIDFKTKAVKRESEVVQSCPTLSDPMDCSLPGSSVHGIFQARVLEWGATAFSNTPTQTHFPIVSWEF